MSFIHLVPVLGLTISAMLTCKTFKVVGQTVQKIVIVFCKLKYNQSKRKKKRIRERNIEKPVKRDCRQFLSRCSTYIICIQSSSRMNNASSKLTSHSSSAKFLKLLYSIHCYQETHKCIISWFSYRHCSGFQENINECSLVINFKEVIVQCNVFKSVGSG